MQDERCDADVILDVVFDRGLLFLVVENLGDRPAHNVRVKFEQPFSGVGGAKKMQRLALFRKLEFLAPRKSIEVFLDRSASYFARDEPTQLRLEGRGNEVAIETLELAHEGFETE